MIDINSVREQFPILNQELYKHDLIYFDNGATSQTPNQVINTISDYYLKINSNVHRGIHTLSQKATIAMEDSRITIQKHLNAKSEREIIFTKGTTEGINIIAHAMRFILKKGDEVIISALEHHSNIVPWQMACEVTGAALKYIPINSKGELVMEEYDKILSEKTKIVAINHVSNALGTINPVKEIIRKAHNFNAWVLIDGAQSVPHMKVDLRDLDADFFVFSGHKAYGPTGVGILYGKESILNTLSPYQGGGEMIKEVNLEKSTYAETPFKFEAGTPNIEANIAMGAAIDFMNNIGLDNIAQQENELLTYATDKLNKLGNIEIYGTSKSKAGVISFNLKGCHPSDVGAILDKLGIAVRTGQHCTQPVMDFFKIPGTVRISFAVYNTKDEIDTFINAMERVKMMLG
ncbi:MAG: cysteine desulfurase [Bacteroidota bacterium]